MKHGSRWSMTLGGRRAPCGARGLKLGIRLERRYLGRSRPVRDAWIETSAVAHRRRHLAVAPRTGRVGKIPI